MVRKCLISLFFLLNAVAIAELTAEQVLDKCTETLDKTYFSFITQATSHLQLQQRYSGARAFMTGKEEKFAIQEFKTDGERMKVISQQWGDTYSLGDGETRRFRPKDESNYNIDIYDGDKRYEHVRVGEDPGTLIVHTNNPEKSMYSLNAQIAQKNCVSQCFGYFRGDLDRFDRIIREDGTQKMTVQEEELNGTLHYVIEADTKRGKYKVWINPEKEYHFSRALLVKKTGDLYSANYPCPVGMAQRTVVENTEFKSIDGLWVPIKAISKTNDAYPGGGYIEGTQEMELTTIQINPDHDALNSFSLDEIKDGARALIPDVPIQYYWNNGELVPNIDKAAIDQLDKMADEILAEGKKRKASPEKTVADASVTLDQILAEYRKTQERLGMFYCEGAVSENDKKTTEDLYTCDGASFGVQVRAGDKVRDCFIWDRKKTMYYTNESVLTSVNKEKPYQLLASVYPGAPLLGYLNQHPERIDARLSKVVKEATVSEEKLGEKNCYAVAAAIGKDAWRVWFSPEQGYHIVKAEIQKDSKPVYLLDQVQLKKTEGVWVPISCRVKDSSRQYTYERTKIELKPDFTAIKAFESAIPDGTGVTVEDMEGKYYWKDGKVVDGEGKNVF